MCLLPSTDWKVGGMVGSRRVRTCARVRYTRYPPREGEAIRYRITNHDERTFEFENYYLKPATCEAAMQNAGFGDFHWVDAMLDPAEQGDPFWDDFRALAPLTAFRATRA